MHYWLFLYHILLSKHCSIWKFKFLTLTFLLSTNVKTWTLIFQQNIANIHQQLDRNVWFKFRLCALVYFDYGLNCLVTWCGSYFLVRLSCKINLVCQCLWWFDTFNNIYSWTLHSKYCCTSAVYMFLFIISFIHICLLFVHYCVIQFSELFCFLSAWPCGGIWILGLVSVLLTLSAMTLQQTPHSKLNIIL